MKRRFVTRERESLPKIAMISLPNIILILLLFFVMLTHMRKDKVKVGELEAAQATELTGVAKMSIVANIYISKPIGNVSRIQLNKKVLTVAGVEKEIRKMRASLKKEERSLMTVMLKVDKDAPMGIVSDVKQALRRSNVLNIVYSARLE